jgi:hypothetical protein
MLERICNIPVKTWLDLISDLNEDVTDAKLVDHGEMDEDSLEEPLPSSFHQNSPPHRPENQPCAAEELCLEPGLPSHCSWQDTPLPDVATSKCNELGWCWIGGLVGEGKDCVSATRQALRKLNSRYLCVSLLFTVVMHIMSNERRKPIITATRKKRPLSVTCIKT